MAEEVIFSILREHDHLRSILANHSQNNINYPKNDLTAEIKNIRQKIYFSRMCLDLYNCPGIPDIPEILPPNLL
jgi:hypothetical protein